MMIAFVITTRFGLTTDGRLWNSNRALGYRFWTRYLDVYDEVRLVGQAVPHPSPPEGWHEATGPGVVAAPVPPLRGPVEALGSLPAVIRRIARHQANEGALHLRAPNILADVSWLVRERTRPFGLEVAGDPLDSLAPGAYVGPFRPLLRRWFRHSLRRQCKQAAAAAYVTRSALQKRYPPGEQTYTTHFSSIDLVDEDFADHPRRSAVSDRTLKIIWVGTLNQLYKAPQVLLSAAARCLETGLDLELVVVGDGRFRGALEAQAASLGIRSRVRFTGQLSAGAEVRAALDAADLFVLASYQEGLPKAMIEAMARGLPCIGSTAGGIPELLAADDLVPPGETEALARKISQVAASPERLTAMARRNLERARHYRLERLRERRIRFYSRVRDLTERWLRERVGS